MSRLVHSVGNGLGYCWYLIRRIGLRIQEGSASPSERELNRLLVGPPSNHNYAIRRGRTLPCYALQRRARIIDQQLPSPLTSFLDIGCCRGYYVIQAAQRPEKPVAVGIDVYEPSVDAACRALQHLGVPNARFYKTALRDVADAPSSFGGPFQTILLLGTYHYLYWGSSQSLDCYASHQEILSRLWKLCTDRVILSARLEKSELPGHIQARAASSEYSTDGFLRAAREYFDVRPSGMLEDYPLYVLHKKPTTGVRQGEKAP